MRESTSSFDRVTRAARLSQAYGDTLLAITESEAILQRLADSPTPELRQAFTDALWERKVSANYIRTYGDREDRALIEFLFAHYEPQLLWIQASLDAAVAGEPFTTEVPPDLVASDMRRVMLGPELAAQEEANRELERYQDAQAAQSVIVLVVLALGVPVLLALVFLIRVYERRETTANLRMIRLEEAALRDSLTGLGNHRAYQEQLLREVGIAVAASSNLSLALIDVDEFKEVNDRSGHGKGDDILRQMGQLLAESCQPGDPRFRIGGDEFAVIMPDSDEAQAHKMMETFRVLASLTGATVSIGLAQLAPGDDTVSLREKADWTLYTAKRRGRNAVYTFSGDDGSHNLMRQAKVKAVRDLVKADYIDVAFQPVFRSDQGGILGYEALARIPQSYELEGPQEAFDIAERIGHVHDLDMLCIRQALRRAPQLREKELLFLNLSPRSLDHASFSAAAMADMVYDAGFSSKQVCFEVTERSTAPIEIVQREVAALRAAGFNIALDDVGSGTAGLDMMRRLQVDFVKIDRTVLLGAMERGAGRGVLLAIIVFATEAGALVIAEGIETPEMLSAIQTLNEEGSFPVQGIQGYILGQPVTAAAQLPLSA